MREALPSIPLFGEGNGLSPAQGHRAKRGQVTQLLSPSSHRSAHRVLKGEEHRCGAGGFGDFFFFFLMWTIFKVFIKLVTILLLFYVLGFWREAYGILAPRPVIEPTPPALEGKVLTTGPPGKSWGLLFK